jgi:predicted nucleic-acid-binding protein
MIGLDTNILVRYLAQDDPVQSTVATEIIERRVTERDPGFISTVAIAETAWVLQSVYRFSDEQLASALELVLNADALVVESEIEVNAAAFALKQGEGSFADALTAELGARAGCMHTLTFDRRAARLPEFELVPTPPTRGGRRK